VRHVRFVPQKQPFYAAICVSALCQEPTYALRQAATLFLLRMMDMERHDGVGAMRDIHDFIVRAT
jgi:hypothetical protein